MGLVDFGGFCYKIDKNCAQDLIQRLQKPQFRYPTRILNNENWIYKCVSHEPKVKMGVVILGALTNDSWCQLLVCVQVHLGAPCGEGIQLFHSSSRSNHKLIGLLFIVQDNGINIGLVINLRNAFGIRLGPGLLLFLRWLMCFSIFFRFAIV